MVTLLARLETAWFVYPSVLFSLRLSRIRRRDLIESDVGSVITIPSLASAACGFIDKTPEGNGKLPELCYKCLI